MLYFLKIPLLDVRNTAHVRATGDILQRLIPSAPPRNSGLQLLGIRVVVVHRILTTPLSQHRNRNLSRACLLTTLLQRCRPQSTFSSPPNISSSSSSSSFSGFSRCNFNSTASISHPIPHPPYIHPTKPTLQGPPPPCHRRLGQCRNPPTKLLPYHHPTNKLSPNRGSPETPQL